MLRDTLLLVFPALMAVAASSDLLTMKIPNRLTLAVAGTFLVVAGLSGLPGATFLMNVCAGALVLAVCFALFSLGWIGGGDAKLVSAIALWLGFGPLFDYLMVTALLGGVLTVLILVLRRAMLPRFALCWSWLDRLRDPKAGVPYGIALAGGAMIVYPQSPVWIAFAGS